MGERKIEMKSIGSVAKRFEITVNRLRDWCDVGLVKHERRANNTRFIPESEYKTIERIIELQDGEGESGPKRPLDEVREELLKDKLLSDYTEENQIVEQQKIMEKAFESSMGEIFIEMGKKMNTFATKDDLQKLLVNFQNLLVQSHQQTAAALLESDETKEKFDKVQSELNEVKKLLVDQTNTVQQQTAAILEKNDTRGQFDKVQTELNEVKKILADQKSTIKSEDEEREERFKVWTLERKVERKLRLSGLKLWNEKPELERFIKTGWFRKEEDLSKKEEFILNYIAEHFEDEVKKELDIK